MGAGVPGGDGPVSVRRKDATSRGQAAEVVACSCSASSDRGILWFFGPRRQIAFRPRRCASSRSRGTEEEIQRLKKEVELLKKDKEELWKQLQEAEDIGRLRN